MNIKDFKWTEKRFGTTFANILKKLGGLSKDATDGSIEYKDDDGNVTKLVTDSNFSSLLAKNGLIEVKWQELKDKRDNGELIPGSLYRITDYNCTTTQENTKSAGHQFDIVLLALSEDKLAEEGWAMMHDNIYDVTFSDGVTLKCYMYCTSVEDNSWNIVAVDTLLGLSNIDGTNECSINEETKTVIIADGTFSSEEMTEENLPYNYFQNSNLSAWKVWYCLDNDKSRFAWADEENGKGVIYRLIDEFNNDIKYDFKNIQFKRKLTNGQYDANGTETWCYTLNIWHEGLCQDASIIGNTLPNDEGIIVGVYNNFIETVDGYSYTAQNARKALSNNCILSKVYDFYYGVCGCFIDDASSDNTIPGGEYSTISDINLKWSSQNIVKNSNVIFIDCQTFTYTDDRGGIYIQKKKVLTES